MRSRAFATLLVPTVVLACAPQETASHQAFASGASSAPVSASASGERPSARSATSIAEDGGPIVSWAGTWSAEWCAAAGAAGGVTPCVEYTITIEPNPRGPGWALAVAEDGYQTMRRLRGTGVARGDTLDVRFDGYLPGDVHYGEDAKPGEEMFVLSAEHGRPFDIAFTGRWLPPDDETRQLPLAPKKP